MYKILLQNIIRWIRQIKHMYFTSGHTSFRMLSPSECRLTLLRLILRLGRMFVFVPCTSLDTGTIFTALLSSKSAGSSFPTTIENGHSPEILRSFSLAQNILCVIVLSKRAAEISTWWISDWDHSYPSESRIEAFPLGDGKISAQKI